MRIAVLGAGNGGQAMAADLTLGGHEVRLAALPEHAHGLIAFEALGGIYLEGLTSGGELPGFAQISMVTTDISKAIRGAEVIMVVIPGFGQRGYMEELVKGVEPGQIVVFNPGKFGSLVFYKMLKEAKKTNEIIIGETETLIYAAKVKGIDHIRIKSVKKEMPFSAMPSQNTSKALIKLNKIFPQFIPAKNIFETSLDDPSIVVHTVSTLLNTGKIEKMGPYRTSHYDITPSMGRVMDEMDNERILVAKGLGVPSLSLVEASLEMYGIKGKNSYEALLGISAHSIQMAPSSLKHRYISEEVPYSLVPISLLAKKFSIKTPIIDSVINLASIINSIDYFKEGRTLEKLGIDKLGLNEIIEYVSRGEKVMV